MANNNETPRNFDGVLGGQSPPPISAAVLGGIAGVQKRLASPLDAVRIAALPDALKYGKEGLMLLINILETETGSVQWAAHNLLWERENPEGKHKLIHYFPLPSEAGVDHAILRYFLASHQWRNADLETEKSMLKIANQGNARFAAVDLITMNRLWGHYSQDQFGFSVQKRIWQELNQDYYQLSDRVKWRIAPGSWLGYNDFIFSRRAPAGHLPSFLAIRVGLYGGSSAMGGGIGNYIFSLPEI